MTTIRSTRVLSASAFVGAVIFFSTLAFAAEERVAPGGTDSGDCSVTACATLGAALANASSGDEIHLAGGVYQGDSSRTYSGGTELTISGGWKPDFSAQDPAVVTTITDAKAGNPAIELHVDAGTANITLRNLTFQKCRTRGVEATVNGSATLNLLIENSTFAKNKGGTYGGPAVAFYANGTGSSALEIHGSTFDRNGCEDCSGGALFVYSTDKNLTFNVDVSTFSKNKTPNAGGAIFLGSSSASSVVSSITNTDFVGNKAGYYGGAMSSSADGEIDQQFSDVSFVGNKAGARGGALVVLADDGLDSTGVSTSIVNAVFSKNSAKRGGGAISVHTDFADSNASLTLRNSTLSLNKASGSGGGLALGGTLVQGDPDVGTITATVVNTIAWNNKAESGADVAIGAPVVAAVTITNSDIGTITGGYTSGGGNQAVDPKLLDTTTGHLKSTSPMRDAGTCSVVLPLEVDIDGDARPTGMGCDIGADELNP